ncbi:unnamed protein product [Nesidiocoris tenuis]|uniref:Uncharacterized protein n=1 Tax=Nesidiocoris tenuis TaxID=355587 RepID=A0A6H5GUL9_9HEMI|nr:unnamed protein product [Nesidiocoris tenuis]
MVHSGYQRLNYDMGLFYYMNSVALLEDLPLEEEYTDPKKFYADAENGYSMNAYNCWIAACLYIFTFLFCSHQFYMNNRTSV